VCLCWFPLLVVWAVCVFVWLVGLLDRLLLRSFVWMLFVGVVCRFVRVFGCCCVACSCGRSLVRLLVCLRARCVCVCLLVCLCCGRACWVVRYPGLACVIVRSFVRSFVCACVRLLVRSCVCLLCLLAWRCVFVRLIVCECMVCLPVRLFVRLVVWLLAFLDRLIDCLLDCLVVCVIACTFLRVIRARLSVCCLFIYECECVFVCVFACRCVRPLVRLCVRVSMWAFALFVCTFVCTCVCVFAS